MRHKRSAVLTSGSAGDFGRPAFADRHDAGRALAAALAAAQLPPDTLVLALPRGGVPVALGIARHLGLALDLCLVRKIGLRDNPEIAVGAVAGPDGQTVEVNRQVAERAGLSEAGVRALAGPVRAELRRRRALFTGGHPSVPVRGRTVLLVDDGVATGATMRAAIHAVRAEGAARVIVAVPVGAPEAVASLTSEADEVHCLLVPPDFTSVGEHYRDFTQVPDSAVSEMLGGRTAA